jgi:hypothetical protein
VLPYGTPLREQLPSLFLSHVRLTEYRILERTVNGGIGIAKAFIAPLPLEGQDVASFELFEQHG